MRQRQERRAPRKNNCNKQMQRLLVLFDSCHMQHRSELDVDQICKYLQREHHLTLSEEVIKHPTTR